MKTAFVFLIAAAPVLLSAADPPKIVSVSVPKGERASVYITFDPTPPEAQVKARGPWVLYSIGPAGIRLLDVEWVDVSALQTERTIRLVVRPAAPMDLKTLDVSWYGPDGIVHVPDDAVHAGTDEHHPPVTGAKKDDADIYIKGSYAGVIDGDPEYNIDSFAGYMHRLQKKGGRYWGRIGAYGQVKTKKSTKADPNSFLTYAVFQRTIGNATGWWGPFSLPYFNYRLAGLEFDRNGKQLNFVNSPVVTFPMRLSGKISGELEPGLTFPNMTFQAGTEFVNVRESPVAKIGEWHTRGLLGATFATGYAPEKKGFHSLQFSSSYQVRLPSAPEIFYDDRFAPIDPKTGKKGDPPPMLGTQARHSLDTKVSYNIVKWAGITFEHTYGSLPPLFNRTGHTFEVGLSLTLKQTSYGRYSILKP